jgi:hypothetical protein
MFGVRLFCIMCGHNRDLGKLPVKVRNIRDLVLAVLESDRIALQKQRTATYPSSLFG